MKANMYTLQNVGHPCTTVNPDQWKDLSYHASERAAWLAMDRHTAHLDYEQWDDHYRVIAPDGSICDRYLFWGRQTNWGRL